MTMLDALLANLSTKTRRGAAREVAATGAAPSTRGTPEARDTDRACQRNGAERGFPTLALCGLDAVVMPGPDGIHPRIIWHNGSLTVEEVIAWADAGKQEFSHTDDCIRPSGVVYGKMRGKPVRVEEPKAAPKPRKLRDLTASAVRTVFVAVEKPEPVREPVQLRLVIPVEEKPRAVKRRPPVRRKNVKEGRPEGWGRLGDLAVCEAWDCYQDGASLPAIAADRWRDWGYASQMSAAGALRYEFEKRGWRLRSRTEAQLARHERKVAA